MTRAPVFRVADVAEAGALVSWTRDNFAALKEAAEETTNHGELLDVTPYVVGNSVYLRFRYDTKDAMGMNMATIATEVCGVVVETETAPRSSPSRGNLCSDKEARRHQRRRRGARPERHRRRSNPARGSSKNACTPRPKRSRNSTHARTWSAPRRPRASGSTPTSPTSSPRCSSPPGRTRRRSSRARTPSRPPRCRTATSTSRSPSPPSKSAPSAAARNSRRSPGPRYPRRQRRRRPPAGSNADALARCIAVGSLAGELSLLSALASRHLSSAHAELGR